MLEIFNLKLNLDPIFNHDNHNNILLNHLFKPTTGELRLI